MVPVGRQEPSLDEVVLSQLQPGFSFSFVCLLFDLCWLLNTVSSPELFSVSCYRVLACHFVTPETMTVKKCRQNQSYSQHVSQSTYRHTNISCKKYNNVKMTLMSTQMDLETFSHTFSHQKESADICWTAAGEWWKIKRIANYCCKHGDAHPLSLVERTLSTSFWDLDYCIMIAFYWGRDSKLLDLIENLSFHVKVGINITSYNIETFNNTGTSHIKTK